MSKIAAIPVWKKNATAAERLQEVAMMALEKPERFVRVVILYEEITDDGIISRQAFSEGITTNEALGVIDAAKLDMYLRLRGVAE